MVGLDISKEMLKFAKNKMSKIFFVRGDAYNLPFKSNTFDLVVSVTMFEFVKGPQKVLTEIYRVLKWGGEVVIGTMNANSFWFLFKRIKSIFKETAYRYAKFYSISELERLFERNNFKEIETRGAIYFPSFFPFLKIAKKIDEKFSDTFKRWAAFIVVRGFK